jgi:hypothetical protein
VLSGTSILDSAIIVQYTPRCDPLIRRTAVVFRKSSFPQGAVVALPENAKTGNSCLFSIFHRHFIARTSYWPDFAAPMAGSYPVSVGKVAIRPIEEPPGQWLSKSREFPSRRRDDRVGAALDAPGFAPARWSIGRSMVRRPGGLHLIPNVEPCGFVARRIIYTTGAGPRTSGDR